MERNESFAAETLKDLSIRLAWAQAEIFGDDIERVQVLAAGDENSVRDLRIAIEENTLVVEQPQYGLTLNITESRWMQVCIRVPKNWANAIHVSTISGLLNARSLSGSRIVLDTVSGDIHAARVTAEEISLKSVSGDINAAEPTAKRLSARSLSGNVSLNDIDAQSLKCTTVNGEQRIRQKGGFEQMELRTVSGDVTLQTAVEKINVLTRSISGRVKAEGVTLTQATDAPVVRITGVSADLKLVYVKE
ncbi:MAG: DUF4097 family beta strand repeat-containing protein [Eubacteriales bacterium]|nr:DUF4097 family beta strand repeat-containing protein [Eubacteriales bacterium]